MIEKAKKMLEELELDYALGGEVSAEWIATTERMIKHIEKLEKEKDKYAIILKKYKVRAAKYKKDLEHFEAVEQFIDETQN